MESSRSLLSKKRDKSLRLNMKRASVYLMKQKQIKEELAEEITKQLSIILSQAEYNNCIKSFFPSQIKSQTNNLGNKTTMFLNPFGESQLSANFKDIQFNKSIRLTLAVSLGCISIYYLYYKIAPILETGKCLNNLLNIVSPSFIFKEDTITIMAVVGILILFVILVYEFSVEKAYRLDLKSKSKEALKDIKKNLKLKSLKSKKPAFIPESKIIEIYSSKFYMTEARFKSQIYEMNLMHDLQSTKNVTKIEIIIDDEPQIFWVYKKQNHL